MFEYVEINGKKFPCKYGFNALRHFSRMSGTSISDMESLGTNMTFDTAICLIFCGLKDGARAAKESFNYTMDDLGDDLDNDMGGIERCMLLFTEQMGGKENHEKKSQKVTKVKKKK
tara:strand:- start:16585 stop:16932 length:348 start_codon:yes stop_codon:yes gene_type:complete